MHVLLHVVTTMIYSLGSKARIIRIRENLSTTFHVIWYRQHTNGHILFPFGNRHQTATHEGGSEGQLFLVLQCFQLPLKLKWYQSHVLPVRG